MAVAKVYGQFMIGVNKAEVNFETDTIKVSLHSNLYIPDQDNHNYYDDVTSEISGTGYTTGGAALVNKSVSYDSVTNVCTLDADDPTWSNATLSAVRYAVFYKDSGDPATSPLICYVDFTSDQSVSASNLSIVLPATGLVTYTVA